MTKPTLISKPAFTVAGINWHGKMADAGQIPQLWEVFPSRAHELRQRVNPLAFYGVMGNSNEQTSEFDYMAGQQVENGDNLPTGMSRWDLPAQTYAVFATTLPKLQATFAEITQWLPTSGYQRAPGPEFELYDETFDPNDPEPAMFVYVPVVKD